MPNLKIIRTHGSITPALLIIVAVFIVVIYALLFILSQQFEFSQRRVASDRALNIAEAGINYYRWHLTQDPDDFTDGEVPPGSPPFIHEYVDPQGDVIGTYSLEIDPPTPVQQAVTIRSTGWVNQYPRVKRTIEAKYGRIVLTKFAFLHNSNMWFGNDITVTGPVFSNGGIRLDGHNYSTVESSKETYTCGVETGCTTPETKPGLWGNGEIDELWDFPVVPIDFDSIKVDFNDMMASAETDGLYLGPSSNQGYHIVFTSDGNFTVYEVTGTSPYLSYSIENACESLYQNITSQTSIGTYSLADNPIIFAEDTLWLDGVVNGKTTVVAARFPLGTFNANIWIYGDLTYLAKDGTHKLGIVAEKDIIFARNVPDIFDLHGALLAQNGRTIRHHYNYFGCRDPGAGSFAQKNEFNFFGSLISNQRSYWNFSSGPQSPSSGFVKTTLEYDSSNFSNPPPYFPAYGGYEFLSWQEIRPD